MRIIKKPKLGPTTCPVCGCVFVSKKKDLRWSISCVKDHCYCPVCNAFIKVNFHKEENHDTNPNENRDS